MAVQLGSRARRPGALAIASKQLSRHRREPLVALPRFAHCDSETACAGPPRVVRLDSGCVAGLAAFTAQPYGRRRDNVDGARR